MEKRNSGKYEYVPDVSRIMRQAGYSMDLMEILAEPVSAKADSDEVICTFIPAMRRSARSAFVSDGPRVGLPDERDANTGRSRRP